MVLKSYELPDDTASYNSDKNCAVCQAEFGLVHAKKHKCKFCNRGVCVKCSPEQVMHPKTKKEERICSACLGKMMESHFSQNFNKQIRDLKDEKIQRKEELNIMIQEKQLDLAYNQELEGRIKGETERFSGKLSEMKDQYLSLQERQEELRIEYRKLKEVEKNGSENDRKNSGSLADLEKELGDLKRASEDNKKNLLALHGTLAEMQGKGMEFKTRVKEQRENAVSLVVSESERELEGVRAENAGIEDENIGISQEVGEYFRENKELDNRILTENFNLVIGELKDGIFQRKEDIDRMAQEKQSDFAFNQGLEDTIKTQTELFSVKINELKQQFISQKERHEDLRIECRKLKDLEKKYLEDDKINSNTLANLEKELEDFKPVTERNKKALLSLHETLTDLQEKGKSIKNKTREKIENFFSLIISETERELDGINKENYIIEGENNFIAEEIETYNNENKELDCRVLTESFNIQIREIQDEMTQRKEDLNIMIQEKQSDLARNQVLEDSIKAETENFSVKLNDLKNLISSIQKQQGNLLLQYSKLKDIDEQFHEDAEKNRVSFINLEKELKDLKPGSENNKKKIVDLQETLEELQEKGTTVKTLIREREVAISLAVSEREHELEGINNGNTKIGDENEGISQEIEAYIIENKGLDDRMITENFKIQIREFEDELMHRKEDLNTMIQGKQSDLTRNQELEDSLKKETDLFSVKSNDLKDLISSFQTQKETLLTECAKLKDLEKKYQEDDTKNNETLIDLEKELKKLKPISEVNKNNLLGLQETLEELQDKGKSIKDTIREGEIAISLLVSEKENELSEMNHRNTIIENENNNITQELEEYSKANKELDLKILTEKFTIQIQEIQDEITQRKEDLNTMIIQKQSDFANSQLLEDTIKQETDLFSVKLNNLKDHFSSLQKQHKELASKNTSLKHQKKEHSETIEKNKSSLTDLEKEQKSLKLQSDSNEKTLQSLRETLNSLQNEKKIIENKIREKREKGSLDLSEKETKLSNELEDMNHRNHLIEDENDSIKLEIEAFLKENEILNERILSEEIQAENRINDSLISTTNSKYSQEEEARILELREKSKENKQVIQSLRVSLEGNSIVTNRAKIDREYNTDPGSRPCARCLIC